MRKHYPAAIAAALVALAAARAWTCDDAFITFRVVEQLLAGNGPVFNAGERVQVFTHPLWFFVLAAWRATGATLFPGVMVLSMAIFAAALGFLCAAFRDRRAGLAVALAAAFLTRPIVDFATGGLETPATFLLFAAALFAIRSSRPRLALALLALLPLNRLDLMPWALPFAWLCAAPTARSRLSALAWLCAPALAWMAFATIYYGSPLPNTAVAKLGAPLADRMDQGLAYVVASLSNDAGSLALVFLAPGLAGWQWGRGALDAPDRRLAAACLVAAAVGFTYPIYTGGDFMLGRFVLPALWALVALLAVVFPEVAPGAAKLRAGAVCLGGLACATLVTGQSTAELWIDLPEASRLRAVGFVGATDERRVYIPWLGAYAPRRATMHPETAPASPNPRAVLMLGQNGYFAPRTQVVTDIVGLSDPFMARVAPLPHSRPGHEYRTGPEGWMLWRDPAHHFADPRLDAFASDLRGAHLSAALWTPERWKAIGRLLVFGRIDPHALFVSGGNDTWRIVGDVAKIFRPFRADSYLVWIRRHDAGHLSYFMAFPHGIDRRCDDVEVAPADSETTGIVVAAGEPLEIRCPKARIGRDAILMRVGAWQGEGPNRRISYDGAIEIVRPRLGWTSGLSDWIVQGWNEAPDTALATVFVLLGAAGLLFGLSCRRA